MIQKLSVDLNSGKTTYKVGELVVESKAIFFKYEEQFLEKKIEISPFKLKLSDQIYKAPSQPFEGLFGVFYDSLPDGWGRLLFDRAMTSRGVDLSSISMLDRLSYVGTSGMGALTYTPISSVESRSTNIFELDTIHQSVNQVLEGSFSEVLEELYQLGGSSGGARPKIVVGYHPDKNHLIYGSDELPEGYEHWIIKFPSSFDPIDIAEIEYSYYQLAIKAGIEMQPSQLFFGKSGRAFFGSKRFDRIGNSRLHVHSAAGMLGDNFRLSSMDYGHLLDATYKLEKNIQSLEKVFRLAAFNLFSHNLDDHSKNFSFLMDDNGMWKFAPAYDLTFSHSGHGFHSTTYDGEGQNPSEKQLMNLASYFKIKNATEIIDEVKNSLISWNLTAKNIGVSRVSITTIEKQLNQFL
jgi:serine/threonine-protein kinase HipA